MELKLKSTEDISERGFNAWVWRQVKLQSENQNTKYTGFSIQIDDTTFDNCLITNVAASDYGTSETLNVTIMVN